MPKLLVIDDTESICKLIKVSLHAHTDLEVFTAKTLEDGMMLLIGEMPDIVLLDIHLNSKFTGLDLYSAIKRNPALSSIHVVLITGTGFKEILEFTKNDTINEQTPYIVKPFSPDKLVKYVTEELELI